MDDVRTIKWEKVDRPISGLATDINHVIRVQREAIPLIFVPGIMGSRLRLSGTNGTGKGGDGLPNLRWDPGDGWFMWSTFSGTSGEFRKKMLVGKAFNRNFLEVDNTDPVTD